MTFSLKALFPREVREITTEGTQARLKAERELAQTVAETPYYEGLGRDLRVERERNHIAERLRAAMLRGHHV
jgi:hypothetical protein